MTASPTTSPMSDAGQTTTTQDGLPGWVLPSLDFATFRLTLVSKAMDRYSLRQFADHGFTYAEWRLLSRLASVPAGATVGQVADMAWVDRAEVSRAAATLEKRGLTARRDNPDDRRTPILHITQAGMDVYRPLLAERSAFHETLMAELTGEERAELDRILTKIAHQLGAVMKNGSAAPD